MMLLKMFFAVLVLALSISFVSVPIVTAQEEGTGNFVQIGEYQVEFDETFPVDLDDDGHTDMTLYYLDDVLVASAEDTNQDGQPDFWLRYTPDWYADMEVRDSDFDGEPDEVVSMDENGQILNADKKGSDSSTLPIVIGIVAGILVLGVIIFVIARSRRNGDMGDDDIEFRPFCANCGTKNEPGSSFCKSCGSQLDR